MFGTQNPKIPATRARDATLLWSGKGLALNLANPNTWTGAQTYNSTITYNSTQLNYGSHYNYSGMYNYSTWYNSGSFYQYGAFITNATIGSLPYVDDSSYLTYDADDYFRNNSNKRYGWGIGNGDTLLAKHHVVGLVACFGTPTPCESIPAMDCATQLGCSATTYYCSDMNGMGYSSCTEYNGACSYESVDCSVYTDSMACDSYSPDCTSNYFDCSTLSDGTMCATNGGCSYDSMSGTCYGSPFSSCTGSYYTGNCLGQWDACSGTPTLCTDYPVNGDSTSCIAQFGCTFAQEPAGYFEGDVSLCMGIDNLFSIFGKTAIPQRTISSPDSTWSSVGGSAISTLDTFDGYTVGQAIKSLIDFGYLQ
jgi:hypothetical protein